MELRGRLVKGHRTLRQISVTDDCGELADFRDRLENCLLALCRGLDVAVPMWLEKNSVELGRFGGTGFLPDQFAETVAFDRLEIRIAASRQ